MADDPSVTIPDRPDVDLPDHVELPDDVPQHVRSNVLAVVDVIDTEQLDNATVQVVE